MSGWPFPRPPRWLSLVVAAMSGIIAIDFLRVYLAEPSNARLIAVGFWVVNAAVWTWVFSLSPRPNDPRDDG